MHAKKLVKWGVALTSSLVLGGVGIPTGSQFVGEAVVYAEDQPVETVTYRIYYYIDDIPEDGVIRVPSYTSIAPYKEGTISKGETIIEKAPHIDGYVLADWSSAETVVTYDSFTGENVWHDTDWVPATGFFYKKVETPVETPVEKPAETPTDQPTEKPATTPTEKPVEKPAETPTDKPVEQLTDASSLTDQTAGKVQAVTATDKKTVDKSAPSTPAVKTEEVSQPVAKTLPKTGDSSSMLLVLGGFLSGLSGLGLAATSRKRD
ncbi:LPXTG cell wall anchor domain-containing protein [Streptococcus suis]|uniref:LPXTG cell wall anchor domain-containing protein n=1 Tax=Streptococcus suis TaxID=1307 RepID=UPI0005CE1E85|nr:LPXTG cell wall anchor domain-containing protein [Streptococcus suis]NQH65197.1 LPXTG cell wall anchor domain-containing protein [Streptococcus suis]CYU52551.1 choline binding protein [Streptococcus suis]